MLLSASRGAALALLLALIPVPYSAGCGHADGHRVHRPNRGLLAVPQPKERTCGHTVPEVRGVAV